MVFHANSTFTSHQHHFFVTEASMKQETLRVQKERLIYGNPSQKRSFATISNNTKPTVAHPFLSMASFKSYEQTQISNYPFRHPFHIVDPSP